MSSRRAAGTRTGAADAAAPGAPVRGSHSGRPVMALLDLLGRRWTLRVIWELRAEPLLFRALQERCEGMSSSVLNERLHELRAADVVELGDGGYRLSGEGRRLLEVFPPLYAWAERWAARSASGLEQQRDRPIVDERDRHVRAEHAAPGLGALAEALVELLGLLRARGVHEARPIPAPRIAVEGELADAEDLAVAERLVHVALGVGEHAQRAHLRGEAIGVLDARPRG